MEVNYQNPLHLAAIIEGSLSVDRPNAHLAVTSNPGTDDDHYIALVQRVYRDKGCLADFAGYITYRFREVKRNRKTQYLPVFSSIEIRDYDFQPLNPPVKVHFNPDKAEKDDPAFFAAQQQSFIPDPAKSEGENYIDFSQSLGKAALGLIYKSILDLVDGKI